MSMSFTAPHLSVTPSPGDHSVDRTSLREVGRKEFLVQPCISESLGCCPKHPSFLPHHNPSWTLPPCLIDALSILEHCGPRLQGRPRQNGQNLCPAGHGKSVLLGHLISLLSSPFLPPPPPLLLNKELQQSLVTLPVSVAPWMDGCVLPWWSVERGMGEKRLGEKGAPSLVWCRPGGWRL